jgi:hypothetical protein
LRVFLFTLLAISTSFVDGSFLEEERNRNIYQDGATNYALYDTVTVYQSSRHVDLRTKQTMGTG